MRQSKAFGLSACLFAAALIATISTVGAATRQAAQLSSPPPISQQLQDALAKKSSVKIGDPNVDAALLRRVYEPRGYKPIWTESSNSENETKRVLDQLQHAADEGLDPQNYRGDQLSASPGWRARLEGKLSGR